MSSERIYRLMVRRGDGVWCPMFKPYTKLAYARNAKSNQPKHLNIKIQSAEITWEDYE